MGEDLNDFESLEKRVLDPGALQQVDQDFHELNWAELKEIICMRLLF